MDILYAKDLTFQYSAQPTDEGQNLAGVLWSADGHTLCAAGRYSVRDIHPVLCWGNAGKGKLLTYPVARDTIMDIRALTDGRIAFADGDGTVGVLRTNGEISGNVSDAFDCRPRGESSFPKLSSDGDTVEIAGYDFDGTGWTAHTVRFSVQQRKLEIDSTSDSSLSSPATTGLVVSGWKNTENPKLGSKGILNVTAL